MVPLERNEDPHEKGIERRLVLPFVTFELCICASSTYSDIYVQTDKETKFKVSRHKYTISEL